MKPTNFTLHHGDCLEVMKTIPDGTVDLVLTSPPYDNLRTYNDSIAWTFEIFQTVAMEVNRVLSTGGVCVWVVGDATSKGSETGTSFRHALYFKEIGLNLHDTMIYRKENYAPKTHNRYEQEFEYMFVFSKGRPKSWNPILIDTKRPGKTNTTSFYKTAEQNTPTKGFSVITKNKRIKGNIFSYYSGVSSQSKWVHPAKFPLQLALDHIVSWSNPGDIVLDPFMGSGTTGEAALNLNRRFIGIEIDAEYFETAKKRIEERETTIF